ncbi:hypothetical protein QBZ16_003190 [Prototheca wickerhamii]|uniref:Uncharacterized protein n=1 Tax=Prototheca wickerhamii TaxID=3111 RepID=A0AAD9IKH2_PROWI|nr:hypothetical protein QBZ16_003190 [Prototheca wickerhamii]
MEETLEKLAALRGQSAELITFTNATYLVHSDDRKLFCRLKGYAQAGTYRNATLDTVAGTATVLRLPSLADCLNASCTYLVVVECIPAAEEPCEADEQGNVGQDNVGWRNVGRGNRGIANFGTDNSGNNLWGNRNVGENNVGNGLNGTNLVPFENGNLLTSETVRFGTAFPPPGSSASPPPPAPGPAGGPPPPAPAPVAGICPAYADWAPLQGAESACAREGQAPVICQVAGMPMAGCSSSAAAPAPQAACPAAPLANVTAGTCPPGLVSVTCAEPADPCSAAGRFTPAGATSPSGFCDASGYAAVCEVRGELLAGCTALPQPQATLVCPHETAAPSTNGTCERGLLPAVCLSLTGGTTAACVPRSPPPALPFAPLAGRATACVPGLWPVVCAAEEQLSGVATGGCTPSPQPEPAAACPWPGEAAWEGWASAAPGPARDRRWLVDHETEEDGVLIVSTIRVLCL